MSSSLRTVFATLGIIGLVDEDPRQGVGVELDAKLPSGPAGPSRPAPAPRTGAASRRRARVSARGCGSRRACRRDPRRRRRTGGAARRDPPGDEVEMREHEGLHGRIEPVPLRAAGWRGTRRGCARRSPTDRRSGSGASTASLRRRRRAGLGDLLEVLAEIAGLVDGVDEMRPMKRSADRRVARSSCVSRCSARLVAWASVASSSGEIPRRRPAPARAHAAHVSASAFGLGLVRKTCRAGDPCPARGRLGDRRRARLGLAGAARRLGVRRRLGPRFSPGLRSGLRSSSAST